LFFFIDIAVMDMDRFLNRQSLTRYRKLASAMTSDTARKRLLGYLTEEIKTRLKIRLEGQRK
jgi:hypothetical protein